MPFRPGLVGGHCIGVDPYYLTHKAQEVGYNPEIILAGRRLNDNMGMYVANQVLKLLIQKEHKIAGAKVLVLGITFKENCPDMRNTRVIDLIETFTSFNCNVDIFDPWVDCHDAQEEYGITPIEHLPEGKYDVIILAVAHHQFKQLGIEQIKKYGRRNHVLYDVKYVFSSSEVDGRI